MIFVAFFFLMVFALMAAFVYLTIQESDQAEEENRNLYGSNYKKTRLIGPSIDKSSNW